MTIRTGGSSSTKCEPMNPAPPVTHTGPSIIDGLMKSTSAMSVGDVYPLPPARSATTGFDAFSVLKPTCSIDRSRGGARLFRQRENEEGISRARPYFWSKRPKMRSGPTCAGTDCNILTTVDRKRDREPSDRRT